MIAQHSIISTVLTNETFESIYKNKYTIVCIKVTTIIDFILILLTPNKTTFLFYLPVVTNIGPTSTCHFVEDFFHKRTICQFTSV